MSWRISIRSHETAIEKVCNRYRNRRTYHFAFMEKSSSSIDRPLVCGSSTNQRSSNKPEGRSAIDGHIDADIDFQSRIPWLHPNRSASISDYPLSRRVDLEIDRRHRSPQPSKQSSFAPKTESPQSTTTRNFIKKKPVFFALEDGAPFRCAVHPSSEDIDLKSERIILTNSRSDRRDIKTDGLALIGTTP